MDLSVLKRGLQACSVDLRALEQDVRPADVNVVHFFHLVLDDLVYLEVVLSVRVVAVMFSWLS